MTADIAACALLIVSLNVLLIATFTVAFPMPLAFLVRIMPVMNGCFVLGCSVQVLNR